MSNFVINKFQKLLTPLYINICKRKKEFNIFSPLLLGLERVQKEGHPQQEFTTVVILFELTFLISMSD